MHKHHIVFRSQRGLDIERNLIDLSYMDHEGKNGPHMNKEVNLKLKRDLQKEYYELFPDNEYSIEEIAILLNKSKKYIEKHFRKVPNFCGVYKRDEIIKKLMGGKFYFD